MDLLTSLFEGIFDSLFAFPIIAYKRGGIVCCLAFIGFIFKLAFPHVLKLTSREQHNLFFLWFFTGAYFSDNKDLALVYAILMLLTKPRKSTTEKSEEKEEKEL